MSDRERWIVYPLLFLTLGIALRNQFFPTRRFGAVDLRAGELSAQRIRCNELVVNDKADCRDVKFDSAAGNSIRSDRADSVRSRTEIAECHALNVLNRKGQSLVMAGEDLSTKSGIFQVSNSSGMPLAQIRPSDSGGLVIAYGHQGKVLVMLGHEGRAFGVFAQYPQIGPPFPLTPPIPGQIKPAPAPSSPQAAPIQKSEDKKEGKSGGK
jgi:hypothetical protein